MDDVTLDAGLDRAADLLGKGDRAAALTAYQDLCARFPDQAPPFIRAGELLFEFGRVAEAETLLADAVARLPAEPWLLRIHALCGRDTQGLDEAERRFRRVVDAFPAFGPGEADLIHFLLHSRRDLAAAEQAAEQALATLPDYVWVMDVHAQCADAGDNTTEAAARWHALRMWHPSHTRGYWGEARALLRLGRMNDAERTINAGRELFPNDPDLIRLRAEAATQRRDWPEAAQRWAAFRAIRTQDPEALLTEPECLLRIGQAETAATVLAMGAALRADWLDLVRTRAAQLGETGEAALGDQLLAAAGLAPPATPTTWFEMPAEAPRAETAPPPPPAVLPADDAALLSTLVDLWLTDFAAFDRAVRSFATSDGGSLRSAFRPATATPVGTAAAPLTSRPRLAILVSGRLGAFREAHQSWPLLRLGTADTTVFVHGWADTATSDEVGAVYGTPHVLLENLDDEAFAGLSEACLAHYSLRTAWGMMAASDAAFDLVLRIRPDLMTYGVQDLDWTAIRDQSRTGNVIFADDVKYRTGNKLAVGCRFAAGAPELMAAYAATFGRQQAQRWEHLPLYPETDEARTSLAATLFYACVDVQPLPHVLFGD